MPALGAVEVQRHPLLARRREEHGLVVLAGRAARVSSAGQRRVGSHVAQHDGALSRRVADLRSVDTPLSWGGVLLVAAVAADEDQDLGGCVGFWVGKRKSEEGRLRGRKKRRAAAARKCNLFSFSSSLSLPLSFSRVHLALPVLLRVQEIVGLGAEAEFRARGRRHRGCRRHFGRDRLRIKQEIRCRASG